MKQRPRIYYSDSQKALMWERWRKGDSLQQIAQLFLLFHLGPYHEEKAHDENQDHGRHRREGGHEITTAGTCRGGLRIGIADEK